MIHIKTKEDIDGLRAAGRIVAQTFSIIKPLIKPGAVLREIDKKAEAFILQQNA